MRKIKSLAFWGVIFGLFFSLMPILAVSAEAEDETPSSKMLHFTMTVKWGNVDGKVEDAAETNFDGSVNVDETARVSLLRTLLFDKHNSDADKIISKHDPVSWNSLIYGHWDGVRVVVSSPANKDITIETAQGSVTKTAEEFYNMTETFIEDVGSGREIVIKIHPAPENPHFFLTVLWGKVKRADYALRCTPGTEGTARCILPIVNFSGSFKIDSGGTLSLVRTLRFEFPDKVTGVTDNQIDWNSYIQSGIDGILVDLKLDSASLDENDTITLSFNKHNWEKSYSIIDLYHNNLTIEVKSGYGVILKRWRRPNRSLIRAKGTSTVYMLEDGIRKLIPSPDVFNAQGLDWSDIEEVDQEEVESYIEGDTLGYREGTVIQGSGPTVYVISEGKKRPFVSVNAFNGLGYKWGIIKRVSDAHLSLYETGEAISENSSYPEGALIQQEGDPTVWQIKDGKRKPVPSISVFNANKWGWNYVLKANAEQLNKFSQGNAVGYPDGSLLADPSGKVYKIDQGKKRWVRSARDFTRAGYKWNKIISVQSADVDKFEEGDDIVGNDLTS